MNVCGATCSNDEALRAERLPPNGCVIPDVRLQTSRECLGHHRKGTPGTGNAYQVFIKCLMPDNHTIEYVLNVQCRIIVSL